MHEARRNKSEELQRKLSSFELEDLWLCCVRHSEQLISSLPLDSGPSYVSNKKVWTCHSFHKNENKNMCECVLLFAKRERLPWRSYQLPVGCTHPWPMIKDGLLQLQTLRHLRRFASDAQVDRNNNFPYSWSIPPSSSPDIGKSATTGCLSELRIIVSKAELQTVEWRWGVCIRTCANFDQFCNLSENWLKTN